MVSSISDGVIERMASPVAHAVKQALPGEELCGQCSDKANHRQTAVELFGARIEIPSRIRCCVSIFGSRA